MTTYRYDPYLWVHLAGLATVPFWLVLCLLGLAVGYPMIPWLELTLVLGLGSLPVLYMQLRRPFSIFGVLWLALKPTALGEERRILLTVFRSWRVRLTAPWVAILLIWIGFQLYRMAPVAASITPWNDWGRAGGLAIATLGFFGANLFLQVPVSVVQVLLTPEKIFQATQPYPTLDIKRDFTHIGLAVGKLLPTVIPPEPLERAPVLATRPTHTGAEPSKQDFEPVPLKSEVDPEQVSGMQGI
jgi:hypothetical protein